MHNWTAANEWHVAAMHVQGLREKNFWEGLPIQTALEAEYPTIKAEFNKFIDAKYTFTQDDQELVQKGSWTENFIFQSGIWEKRACKLMPKTCKLLQEMPEVQGTQPHSRTQYWKRNWNVKRNLVGIYKMGPGRLITIVRVILSLCRRTSVNLMHSLTTDPTHPTHPTHPTK